MITGGAGFIGSHLVRLLVNRYPNCHFINVDKLTYAGNLDNLKDIKDRDNYEFLKCDICNYQRIKDIMNAYDVNGIIHLAAESHVDRSINDPFEFVKTNVIGTVTLLQAAREYWESLPERYEGKLFYHVSTDEVYGALGLEDKEIFTENCKYKPNSPYSASKASSDHFVRSFHKTYGMPTIISNCSNNYGPNQYPEKLIPLVVDRICKRERIPVYGVGDNVRDWLYVVDHADAIDKIFHDGKPGETYNIGGNNEINNLDLIQKIILIADEILGREPNEDMNLITFIPDRKGHDKRYAIDATKLKNELGWQPSSPPFYENDRSLRETVQWYIDNRDWVENSLKRQ